MKQLLLISCMLSAVCIYSQLPVQLHLKKNGKVKMRIVTGTSLLIKTTNGNIINAPLLKIKKDSLYFAVGVVAAKDISFIKLPRTKPKMKWDWEEFGYVTLGVSLTTGGLVLANWQDFPQALGTASLIGYSQYVFRGIKSISFKKRRFRIGDKYSLRIWDLR